MKLLQSLSRFVLSIYLLLQELNDTVGVDSPELSGVGIPDLGFDSMEDSLAELHIQLISKVANTDRLGRL